MLHIAGKFDVEVEVTPVVSDQTEHMPSRIVEDTPNQSQTYNLTAPVDDWRRKDDVQRLVHTSPGVAAAVQLKEKDETTSWVSKPCINPYAE